MQKCCKCLCRSCLNVCCDRKNCTGKRTDCERYAGFEQLQLGFSIPPTKQYKRSPRYPLSYYGISKNRKKKLKQLAKSVKYKDLVRECAYRTDKGIAEYIIKHVEKGKSWDVMEMDLELGRICVGRSNFYGYVRKFYSIFDKEVGKENV